VHLVFQDPNDSQALRLPRRPE